VAILQIFLEEGLHIDASSGYECRRAMAAGFKPDMMSLSSQAHTRRRTMEHRTLVTLLSNQPTRSLVDPCCCLPLSSQELYPEFAEIVSKGVKFNACSLNQVSPTALVVDRHCNHALTPHLCLLQLEQFGLAFEGTGQEVGLRFNPGAGSGGTGKTNVGGPSSSFGIWIGLLEVNHCTI